MARRKVYKRRKSRKSRARRYKRSRKQPLRPMVEYKSVDSIYPSTDTGAVPFAFPSKVAIGTAGIWCLNCVSQGTGAYQRVGRRIRMTSVYIRGQVFHKPDLQLSPYQNNYTNIGCRLLLIYDRQNNGQAPVWLDMFRSVAIGGPRSDQDYLMPVNLNNASRFLILLDKQMTVQSYGPTNVQGNGQDVKIYKRLNLPTQFFDTSTGAYSDISTGALWFLLVQEDPAFGTVDSPTIKPLMFQGNVRVRFTD